MKPLKNKIEKAIRRTPAPEISAQEYGSVDEFWRAVESEYPRWRDIVFDTAGIDDESLSDDEDFSLWLKMQFFSKYYEEAWTEFPEAYEYDPQYRCSVCGDPIDYDSRDSVMLKDGLWRLVLDRYGITTADERESSRRKMEFYRKCDLWGGYNGKRPENTYIFVCNRCIEKALGRKIRPEDIVSCMFNDAFVETHFRKGEAAVNESASAVDIEEGERTERIFAAAKKMFGTTYDIREAGYILPDGSMLDFSGRKDIKNPKFMRAVDGQRADDHREISKIKAIDPEAVTDICDFIRRGAIRVDCNAGSINLYLKPTMKQRDILGKIIRKNDGYVYVDFGYDVPEHYIEYEGENWRKILGDIDRYFDENEKN